MFFIGWGTVCDYMYIPFSTDPGSLFALYLRTISAKKHEWMNEMNNSKRYVRRPFPTEQHFNVSSRKEETIPYVRWPNKAKETDRKQLQKEQYSWTHQHVPIRYFTIHPCCSSGPCWSGANQMSISLAHQSVPRAAQHAGKQPNWKSVFPRLGG